MTRFCYSVLVGSAWLGGFLFLLGSLHVTFAQEPMSQPPDRSRTTVPEGGEAEATTQADEPESAQGNEKTGRRRFLTRLGPQQLMPEEQEEAKRLSTIAARMGTDPTAIIGRAQTLFRYDALEGGSRNNNLVARLDVPYHGNFLLRAEMPYVWSNPNQSGTSNQNGVSDLFVRAGARVFSGPVDALFAGMDFTFPTADSKQLGSGKYTVGPGVATAHVFPAWGSLFFMLLQHQLSVGGDPSRQPVSASRVQGFFNTIWTDRWWTQVEAVTQVDWERKAKNSMTLEVEGGHRFTKDWGVWVRPGVGLWGRNIPGAYEWNIEVGIRRMFAGF